MIILILHIVRSGETIRVIADNYQCEVSDITSNNLHITDFKNLRPGMKLRIPFLTKPVIDTLEETESFISDYYPSINTKFTKKEKEEEKVIIPKEEIKPEIIEEKEMHEAVELIRTDHEEEKAQKNYANYQYSNVRYCGNVVPNIPDNFIKKI